MFHPRMHFASTVLVMRMSCTYGDLPTIRVKTFDSCCAHATSGHVESGLLERV